MVCLEAVMKHSLWAHNCIGYCARYTHTFQHPGKVGIPVPILQMGEPRLREQSGLLKVTLLSGRAST